MKKKLAPPPPEFAALAWQGPNGQIMGAEARRDLLAAGVNIFGLDLLVEAITTREPFNLAQAFAGFGRIPPIMVQPLRVETLVRRRLDPEKVGIVFRSVLSLIPLVQAAHRRAETPTERQFGFYSQSGIWAFSLDESADDVWQTPHHWGEMSAKSWTSELQQRPGDADGDGQIDRTTNRTEKGDE